MANVNPETNRKYGETLTDSIDGFEQSQSINSVQPSVHPDPLQRMLDSFNSTKPPIYDLPIAPTITRSP